MIKFYVVSNYPAMQELLVLNNVLWMEISACMQLVLKNVFELEQKKETYGVLQAVKMEHCLSLPSR